MRVDELRARLQELNAVGYVPSERSGPTGIGHTLESRLGLAENNLPIPDIGGRVEVKATRANTNNLITLFTFNRAVWKFKNKDLVERWGYFDEIRDRRALYTTVSATGTNALGLQLSVSEDGNHLSMTHMPSETLLATWDMYYIVGKFVTKFERMLFVHAASKRVDGKEFFHYNERGDFVGTEFADLQGRFRQRYRDNRYSDVLEAQRSCQEPRDWIPYS